MGRGEFSSDLEGENARGAESVVTDIVPEGTIRLE
jgi:hypothetical protein